MSTGRIQHRNCSRLCPRPRHADVRIQIMSDADPTEPNRTDQIRCRRTETGNIRPPCCPRNPERSTAAAAVPILKGATLLSAATCRVRPPAMPAAEKYVGAEYLLERKQPNLQLRRASNGAFRRNRGQRPRWNAQSRVTE